MAELINKSGSRGSSRAAAPRVDLTAMVDLAFLLITFFMLTTTLAKQNAMPLSMPVPDVEMGHIADNRAMTILLDDKNSLVWYSGQTGKPISGPSISTFNRGGIRKAILNQQKVVYDETGKGLIVIVKPGNKSRYGDLVNILDELSNANVKQYAIANLETEDLEMLEKF